MRTRSRWGLCPRTPGLLRAAAAALSAAALFTGGVAMAKPQPGSGIGLPVDASVEGHRIDWLMNTTNVMTGVLFLIMVGWLIYASLIHNRKHEARYDHGTSKRSMISLRRSSRSAGPIGWIPPTGRCRVRKQAPSMAGS